MFSSNETLLEHRQRDQSRCRAGVDRTHTSAGLSRHGRPGKEPARHRNAKFFLLKRSPLSIKEKQKEKNRGKGYSEMRVCLPPPWSQTQVCTRRALGLLGERGSLAGLAGGRSSAAARLPLSLSPSPRRRGPAVGARSLSGSSLPRVLLSLSCCSQWCFSFSSGKQVSIYFYFLLPRIRC